MARVAKDNLDNRCRERLHQPIVKGSVFISQEFTTMEPTTELVTVDCPQTAVLRCWD